MINSKKNMLLPVLSSYWRVFRLCFVLFNLYLIGDVFYRWDGFRYYASFSDYIPSVALVTILWSVVASIVALLIWLTLQFLKWFFHLLGWNLEADDMMFFICAFLVVSATVWIAKQITLYDIPMPLSWKLGIFFGICLAAIFLTWMFCNKMTVIQERITPLIWLFGIWAIVSFPLVVYHTWDQHEEDEASGKIISSLGVDRNRPNILLITFDALTARDMAVYGYQKPSTPFISKWSQNASLFKRAQAAGNYTTPTTASIMTGKRVWTHQAYYVEGIPPVKSDMENLALVLKNNDYLTMAFVANNHASVESLGIARSFQIAPPNKEFGIPKSLKGVIEVSLNQLFHGKIPLHDWIIKEDFAFSKILIKIFGDIYSTERPAELTFKKALDIINSNTPQPFFAWIHLWPPHSPYLPPDSYMGFFDSSSQVRTFESQVKDWLSSKHPSQITRDRIRARYDEYILYCDDQFNNFISQLPKNIMENTVIILSSDHGESFEHNYKEHGDRYLYEQVTHIPLIIKEPGQTEGRFIEDLVEQIDIPPTILGFAGIPIPSWMEGRSLMPLIKGMKIEPHYVISSAFVENPGRWNQIKKGTIAIWEDDYKLIHYLGDNKSLLFNLSQDPGELNNIFDKEPTVGRKLLIIIRDELKKANDRIRKGE